MLTPLNVIAAASGILTKSYTLTAGIQGAPQTRGYQDGSIFGQDAIGVLVPDNDLHGTTISQIAGSEPGDSFVFSFAPSGGPDDDTSWLDISITGLWAEGNFTLLLARADRTSFDPNAGTGNAHSSWAFSPLVPNRQFVTGEDYDVVIRWKA